MRHRFLLDILSGAFLETSSKLAGRLFARPGVKGAYPEVETPVTPDEPDEVDTGDVVEGVGVYGWRWLRRVRRVGWWFLGGFLPVDEHMVNNENGLFRAAPA